MPIYSSYDELLAVLAASGLPVRTLGHCPDGSPMVCVRSGGDKLPAIFITAGSHSTEQAGVSAAVELARSLQTEHAVYVLPTRDPIGMNGYAYALGLGLGETPSFSTFDEVEEILRSEGEVAYDEDGIVLSLIGDYGYASSRPSAQRPHPQWMGYRTLQEVARERPQVFAPFRGRRVYMTPGQEGVEGTGLFGRAYTLIIGLDGEILHINRFHDTAWAPVEPRVTRSLLAEIKPGLSFDLHESQIMENRFWLSARHQADADNQLWEERAASAVVAAIATMGAPIAEDLDVQGIPLEQTWFRKSERGVYWLDATIRGEGFNLMDFASRQYGLAFGTEMGMYGSFEERVNLALTTVHTAVEVFSERYR
ncbi:MAG: hypothetical protein ACKVJG_23495 [Candidatus Latescibacterota bacterium]|jgi:hypothetical protein